MSPSGSSDQNVINQALSGCGTVYLQSGVYNIDGQIRIGSNTILTGSPDAILRVSSSSSQFFTGGTGVIGAISEPLNNVEICGFQSMETVKIYLFLIVPLTLDPHDAERLIYLQADSGAFSNNISIHDMKLYDSYSVMVFILPLQIMLIVTIISVVIASMTLFIMLTYLAAQSLIMRLLA